MKDSLETSCKNFLYKCQQFDMILYMDSLQDKRKQEFIEQVSRFSSKFTAKIPKPTPSIAPENFTPLKQCNPLSAVKANPSIIQSGKVSTFVLAGGSGSRLKSLYPKGFYPISPIKQKSLFQLVIERTIAAEKYFKTDLRVGFLVAEDKQALIIDFFKKHDFFGYAPERIDLLPQPSLPFYTNADQWILAKGEKVGLGPNGNGGMLEAMHSSGYFSFLKKQGIEYLSVVPVDNPLADPYQAQMIASHIATKADVTFLCYKRKPEEDMVGLPALKDGRTVIVDYSQIPHTAIAPFELANLNVFIFSIPFLERMAKENSLPIHWVEKSTTAYITDTQKDQEVVVKKGEKFITDLIAMTDKANPLLVERDAFFAPLKSVSGTGSVAEVQQQIFKKNRQIMKTLTGHATTKKFELSMDFYYPTSDLCAHWKNRELPLNEYITPEL